MNRIYSRPYIGITRTLSKGRTIFRSKTKPTETSHGHLYSAVIGPFRTKRGALFMLLHGDNNPHCQTVKDAERLAQLTNL